jgi:dihydroorotase
VDKHGKVHELIRDVIEKGVKIDVGHGSHFSFDVARKVLDAGIVPNTLGADMHGYNTRIAPPPGTPDIHSDPEEGDHMFAGAVRFSLTSAMTSMLALGLTLDQVVPMVTSNAASMLGMADEIGHLKPGAVADVSVLNDERGQWTLRDNEGHRVNAERMLTPRFCLRAGERFDADAPTLPQFTPAQASA